MLRNIIVAGLVSALMGGFVLTYQAISPTPQPAMEGDDEAAAEMRDREDARMADANGQQPMNGQAAAPGAMTSQQAAMVQQSQPGRTMGQVPPGTAPMQTMPMMGMGMCGQMMNMMMGGGGMAGAGGGMGQQAGRVPTEGWSQPSAPAQPQAGSGQQDALQQEFEQLQREFEELKSELPRS